MKEDSRNVRWEDVEDRDALAEWAHLENVRQQNFRDHGEIDDIEDMLKGDETK